MPLFPGHGAFRSTRYCERTEHRRSSTCGITHRPQLYRRRIRDDGRRPQTKSHRGTKGRADSARGAGVRDPSVERPRDFFVRGPSLWRRPARADPAAAPFSYVNYFTKSDTRRLLPEASGRARRRRRKRAREEACARHRERGANAGAAAAPPQTETERERRGGKPQGTEGGSGKEGPGAGQREVEKEAVGREGTGCGAEGDLPAPGSRFHPIIVKVSANLDDSVALKNNRDLEADRGRDGEYKNGRG